ncbi:UDP-N-acetylglucosamine 1-carboxyvinyltransferase [Serpentinicella sp. ANB-PHB4]|uniref:UDP-N-acetylglucosamine 1-carboxyvinyltransferase n=1 Tax=Serpentinicella sp. ANB-PHB4 TaxID=3074076 RepID=UPI00285512C0|nr:UDP-N-acetylglucosamine 1-carboxyvinyltransferase [Serpentinicella sp. ANB-PHB4]MDR5658870.1 UDP-N-acetylglucosamine 1-carboxyvinyltransferase [Serpentinicella sp. ANB-PHB4]
MDKLLIKGGHKLKGTVNISGFKNAAVALVPATILTEETCIIENLPNISDVKDLGDMLRNLGASVLQNQKDVMEIDTSNMKECFADFDSAKNLRASYYFLGAGLGRFKKAKVAYPGGCSIGSRPIDQHIKGFEALGAKVTVDHGVITVEAEKLVGADIYMDVVSVGATINIMLAAVMAEGTTVIDNAAKEPHIVDVANFLNCMGANVRGAGTDVIKIKGVSKLNGCRHAVIPDQIEAGTYMIAAAATKGNVLINNVIPKHLESITAKLREMDVDVIESDDSIRVSVTKPFKNVSIKTLVYPGFPTDLQQPMSSLLAIAEGTGIITETIFEGRFKHVAELNRMGANIRTEGRIAVIEGVKELMGAKVSATDLRAGAALIVAGLIAKGETQIDNMQYVYRGYHEIVEKLTELGAEIRSVK